MTEKPFLVDLYECEVSGHHWIEEDWEIAGYTLYRCMCCFDTCWRKEDAHPSDS